MRIGTKYRDVYVSDIIFDNLVDNAIMYNDDQYGAFVDNYSVMIGDYIAHGKFEDLDILNATLLKAWKISRNVRERI